MKRLSINLQLVLQKSQLKFFFLVRFGSESGGYTSLPYDVHTSMGLFVTDNPILSIDTPKIHTMDSDTSFKIALHDNDHSFRSILESNSSIAVAVYLGFINNTENTLSGVAPGMPLLSTEDLLLIYKGRTTSSGYSYKLDRDIRVLLECGSPLNILNRTNPFYTDKGALSNFDASDTAFDLVFDGADSIASLQWG